jgi:hypothetical protein
MEKKAAHGHCRISLLLIPLSLFFLSGVTSCGPETDNPPATTAGTTGATTGTPVRAHVDPPAFNADSAYAFVKAQCDLGPRNPGSSAHEKCAAWMEKKLNQYGAKTIVQTANLSTFDKKTWVGKNIIGAFNPDATDRVLLCAHWDTRPFADRDSLEKNRTLPIIGANDGASGVGVLLEVARACAQKNPKIGIDIIFFDLEDYGSSGEDESWCLGSQYWSRNKHVAQYNARFGILLDMVGAKNATFPKEGSSMEYAPTFTDKIWSQAQLMGYGNYFISAQTGPTMDDHVYINTLANIPCVDVVHYNVEKRDYFPFHHRIGDNLNNIDKATLEAVGKVLLEVIYNEY